MTKSSKYRGLSALALLRLGEADLRNLHSMISELNAGRFVDLIRDIEDEIDNSLSLTIARSTEQPLFSKHDEESLYRELDNLRRKDLRIPVQKFADLLTDNLEILEPARIPKFDPRRGLQAWIAKLIQAFSENDVYHAAMRIKHKSPNHKTSDWQLR